MASTTDPRRRNLLIMAGIAVVALLAALLTVWNQSGSTERSEPVAFFPGFARHVAHHDATHIRIVSKANGTIDVVFKPQSGGWVMASRGDYPASFEEVNGTLVGLAAMQTLEPKTSRPEWLSYVGLDAPPKGSGTLITVTDEHGTVLASLIAGKTTDIGDQTGATGLFARKPGSNQSWLVRAVAEIRSSPSDWMEKSVVSVDQSQIQEADMQAISGPSYSVRRDKPSDADFTLTPIPAGREIGDPTAPGNVASAIVGFSFDDVKHAADMDFSNATRLVTKTFEGLSVTVSTIKTGTGYWATVTAAALPDKPLAAKEANAINTKAAGWAYKLADFKGAQFTTPLENLLKPKAPAAKTGP